MNKFLFVMLLILSASIQLSANEIELFAGDKHVPPPPPTRCEENARQGFEFTITYQLINTMNFDDQFEKKVILKVFPNEVKVVKCDPETQKTMLSRDFVVEVGNTRILGWLTDDYFQYNIFFSKNRGENNLYIARDVWAKLQIGYYSKMSIINALGFKKGNLEDANLFYFKTKLKIPGSFNIPLDQNKLVGHAWNSRFHYQIYPREVAITKL